MYMCATICAAGRDMAEMGLDELDEMEDDVDEEEERIFQQYRLDTQQLSSLIVRPQHWS